MAHPVELAGVTKRFGDVTALDEVDLAVSEGTVHGLLGPNGAGKSTLLRCVFGLVRPDSGRVALFGREHHLDGEADALEGVAGFVDRPHFYPYLTARRTLALLAAADGIGAAADIDGVLDRVGLASAAGRRVAGWSTGMLQRLGLAAALLRRPRLLVLDEPTEGLDPAGARDLAGLIRSLADDGVTVVLSSHDMAEVDVMCDDVTILRRGEVVRSAPLAVLRADAPAGRHRMLTSDDAAARRIAASSAVSLELDHRGGLLVLAGPSELHRFVCDMGRADVSVRLLEQDVAPLTALFYSLTDEADALAGSR